MLALKQFKQNLVVSPVLLQETDSTGFRKYVLPDGRRYPSVTTFLGELPNAALVKWKKRKGEGKARAIAKAAAFRGERLHGVLKAYIRNQPLQFPSPFTRNLFEKIQPILNKSVDNIRLNEEPLYSDNLCLAGTPDLIAEWNGQLAVIDFKTTHIQKKEDWIWRYYCQTGAYSVMFNELFKEQIKLAVIIIVSDDDNFEEPQVFEKPATECFNMLNDYAGKLVKHRESERANAAITIH